MGEAKRRKKLDPNYGKNRIFKISEIYYECQKQYGNGGLAYEPSNNLLIFVPEELADKFDNRLSDALEISKIKESPSVVIGSIDLKTTKASWSVFTNEMDELNYLVNSKCTTVGEIVKNINIFKI